MTREQAAKKLKALKALAEKGMGGEKEGARRLYENAESRAGRVRRLPRSLRAERVRKLRNI